MSILATESLTKQYQMGEVTVTALDGVDFSVERGEFVAIMGPSGSGKSTLLHLLGGLDYPTAGEVYLNGEPLSKLSDDQITRLRRRKVGFIFQPGWMALICTRHAWAAATWQARASQVPTSQTPSLQEVHTDR